MLFCPAWSFSDHEKGQRPHNLKTGCCFFILTTIVLLLPSNALQSVRPAQGAPLPPTPVAALPATAASVPAATPIASPVLAPPALAPAAVPAAARPATVTPVSVAATPAAAVAGAPPAAPRPPSSVVSTAGKQALGALQGGSATSPPAAVYATQLTPSGQVVMAPSPGTQVSTQVDPKGQDPSQQRKKAPAPKSKLAWWAVLLIVVGCLAIVAFLLWFFFGRVSKKRAYDRLKECSSTSGPTNAIVGIVASAGKLRNVDVGSLSDPYVVVSVKDSKVQGMELGLVVHRTAFKTDNLEPVWNEPFTWVSPSALLKDLNSTNRDLKLELEVFDINGNTYDKKDESLGYCKVPIGEIMEAQAEAAKRGQTNVAVQFHKTLSGKHAEGKILFHVRAVHVGLASATYHRVIQAIHQMTRQRSFWARVIGVAACPCYIAQAIADFSDPDMKKCGLVSIGEIVIGSVLALLIAPHVLSWIGLPILDFMKVTSLRNTYLLDLVMVVLYVIVLIKQECLSVTRVLLAGALAVMGVLTFLGDIGGDPGHGWSFTIAQGFKKLNPLRLFRPRTAGGAGKT